MQSDTCQCVASPKNARESAKVKKPRKGANRQLKAWSQRGALSIDLVCVCHQCHPPRWRLVREPHIDENDWIAHTVASLKPLCIARGHSCSA